MRKWLVELRGCKTQAEIAKAVGISRSTYANYERGTRPRVDVAQRIAQVLHFDWTRFFEEPDNKQDSYDAAMGE
ncbi:hypothetical protein SD51_12110 [Alicyclobacillus tengchongensis]|nr:hypothetical protein SD51_12110 [Alicyclobacillus tengchongensis]